jgi:hypothetical protein
VFVLREEERQNVLLGGGVSMIERGVLSGTALACLLCIGCSSARESITRSDVDQREVDDLVGLIHGLPPWRASRDLTDQEWDEVVKVAKVVQSSRPSIVVIALRRFIDEAVEEPAAEDYLAETKAFLLMRVVFELPEEAPSTEAFPLVPWINRPPPSPDDPFNVSWPVSWHGGAPRLVARLEGTEGAPYCPQAEYRYFLSRYPMRSLE